MGRTLLILMWGAMALGSAVAQTPAAPAGSASPRPSPGDTWKYRQTKPGMGGGRDHLVQVRSYEGGRLVDEVSVAGQAPVQNEHSGGFYLVNQGVSLFSPYLNVLGELASTRNVRSRDDIACPMDVVCSVQASIAGYERIKVPAGEFNTRKMRFEHGWQYHRYGSGTREVTMWYADEVKRVVKVRSRTVSGGHIGIETDYDLELLEYQLK